MSGAENGDGDGNGGSLGVLRCCYGHRSKENEICLFPWFEKARRTTMRYQRLETEA